MKPSLWLQRIRLPGGRLLSLGMMLGIAILLMQSLASLWSAHTQAIEDAANGTRNLSFTLASRLDAGFRPVEASLRSISLKLGALNTPLQVLHRAGRLQEWEKEYLRQSVDTLDELSNVLLFDASGEQILAARSEATVWLKQYSFPAAEAPDSDALWFSDVISDPHGEYAFLIAALPVRNRERALIGYVAAVINLERFATLFASMQLGQDSVIALRRSDDMRLIVRVPASHPHINSGSTYPIADELREGKPHGTLSSLASPVDGVARITSYRSLEHYPFYVAVSRSRASIFAAWEHRALFGGLVTLFMIGLLFFTSRAIARSENNFRKLFDTVTDLLFVLDHDGQILAVNQSVAERLGSGACHLVNTRFAALQVAESGSRLADILSAARQHGRGEGSLQLRTDAGSALPVEALATSGQWNNKPALFVLCRDVSERLRQKHQLELEVQRRRLLLDQMRDGVFLMNTEGALIEFNPALRDMLGYTDDEMSRLNLADWDVCFTREDFPEIIGRQAGDHLLLETRHRRKDGSEYDAEITGYRVKWDDQHLRFGFVRDITARKQAEHDIRTREARFRAIFERSPIPYALTTESFTTVALNQAFIDTFGYTREEIPDAAAWWAHAYPDPGYRESEMARWSAYMQLLAAGQETEYFETHVCTQNAEQRSILVSFTSLEGQDLSGLILIYFFDITARRRSEQMLRLYSTAFHHAGEGIAIISTQGLLIDANEAFSRNTGYPLAELIGQSLSVLRSGRHDQAYFDDMWHSVRTQGYWRNEIWSRRRNGEVFPEILTISAVRDETGQPTHYVALFSDISSIKEAERQLQDLAHSDSLTGLPNRARLSLRLEEAMHHTRQEGRPLALVYLDLDGFKAINDQHGHAVGDLLLIEIAARIKKVLRESDTLARIGGDEFVILLTGREVTEASVHILERVLAEAARPFQFEDLTLQVSTSLGVSFYRRGDALEAETLMAQADEAMYRSKRLGKNRYSFFSASEAG